VRVLARQIESQPVLLDRPSVIKRLRSQIVAHEETQGERLRFPVRRSWDLTGLSTLMRADSDSWPVSHPAKPGERGSEWRNSPCHV
jgi:hypothetical protein